MKFFLEDKIKALNRIIIMIVNMFNEQVLRQAFSQIFCRGRPVFSVTFRSVLKTTAWKSWRLFYTWCL